MIDAVINDQPHLDFASLQFQNQLVWANAVKHQLDIWKLSPKCPNHLRQAISEHRFRRSDHQLAQRYIASLYGSASLLQNPENALGIWQKPRAIWSQVHALTQAFKQSDPQFPFQRPNLDADIRLNAVGPFGSSREVQLMCQDAEEFQLP